MLFNDKIWFGRMYRLPTSLQQQSGIGSKGKNSLNHFGYKLIMLRSTILYLLKLLGQFTIMTVLEIEFDSLKRG